MEKDAALRKIYAASYDLFSAQEELTAFSLKVIGGIRDTAMSILVSAAENDLNETLDLAKERRLLSAMNTSFQAAVDSGVVSLEKTGESILTSTYNTQFKAIPEQVNLLSQKYPDTGLSLKEKQAIKSLQPDINIEGIRQSKDASLHKLTRCAEDLTDNMRVKIAQARLRGDSIGKLAKDLESTGLNKGVFVTAEERAKVIAITENTNIAAYAREESLQQVNDKIRPQNQLGRKWLALLDGRTSTRCKGLHNQVRAQGENFVSKSDGWQGYMPSAHPRCRCQVIAWHPAWEGIVDTLENEIQASG